MEHLLKEVTVLYVEDEEQVRHNIGLALKRRVKQVELAENGQEGLDRFRTFHPDIIITDLEMPVMNGLEMIRKIREACKRDCPIIVLTAYRDEEHFTEQADAYLYKPVIIDELETLIARLLKKQP